MAESAIIHLLVAALGLLCIAIGFGLPRPGYAGSPTRNQGVGLLITILLFMAGLWLMVWGLRGA